MPGTDPSILLPALAAGLLVLVTHVPLGRMVLARGIVFIDLAIAQVAGLGVVAATAAGLEAGGWAVQAAALGAALLGAAFLAWSERRMGARQEAVIGVLFVTAASAEIILLALSPHGDEHLKDLLVGQILWTTPEQLAGLALVTVPLAAAIRWGRLGGRALLFHAVFAAAVTASVQVVGVFLVFASLIVPALAARSARGGMAVGAAGYGLGLAASLAWDLPTGAAAVCALALAGAAWGGLFSARRSGGTP
jgi:zinc/manganese transport system permease protein